MKKIISIMVICFLLAFLVSCSLTRIETVKKPDDISRMILVESINHGEIQICYDKYTNVMYIYNYRGGISPIYNADGSLYLFGTPKSVG